MSEDKQIQRAEMTAVMSRELSITLRMMTESECDSDQSIEYALHQISLTPLPEQAMHSSSPKAIFKQRKLIKLPLDVKYETYGNTFMYLQGDILSVMTIDD